MQIFGLDYSIDCCITKRRLRTRLWHSSKIFKWYPYVGRWGHSPGLFPLTFFLVKINDAYYREVLLTQKQLPVMLEIYGEFFIFQQGNVLATERLG